MNRELSEVQAGLGKAEEPEIKLTTSAGSSKKQEFQKNIYFCFIDNAKSFDCKKKRASMALDRKVGVGSNNDDLDAPSEEYRFYHGINGESLQGSYIQTCILGGWV